jgi:hypothetical protein
MVLSLCVGSIVPLIILKLFNRANLFQKTISGLIKDLIDTAYDFVGDVFVFHYFRQD